MTCGAARELFSALLDEALTPDERAALDAHVDRCGDCRRELDQLRRTVALLRAVPPALAPAGFVDRVLAATRPTPWHRRFLTRLFVPLPVKLPFEAAAVVLIAASAVYVYQRSPAVRQAARLEAPVAAPPAAAVAPPTETPKRARPATPARSREATKGALADKEPAATPEAAPGPAGTPSVAKSKASDRQPEPSRPEDARKAEGPAATGSRPLANAPSAGLTAPAPLERRLDVSEEKTASPPPSAAPRAAGRLLRPPDVGGRLTVADRAGADRGLADLVARLGGAVVTRRAEARAVIVEVVVPQSAYAELVAGFAGLGRWLPEREPPVLPLQVRVEVSITD